MSKPCLPEVKSTGAEKMGKVSGSPKNYEHPSHKAERLCSGGNAYAEGGTVDGAFKLPPPAPMPTVNQSWNKDPGFTKSMTANEAAGKDPQGRTYK